LPQTLRLKRAKERERKKLVLYILPGLILLFLFQYLPLWGLSFAFVTYKPGKSLFECDFVGFKNFAILFSNPVIRKNVFRSLGNTLGIQFIGYLLYPLPMLFAIFLNELSSKRFKKIVQTVSTLPHFVSWVIIFALTCSLFSSNGAVNNILMKLGLISEPINILTTDKNVWLIQVLLQKWKNVGWSAIVYFAAIAGIDQELYEAAMVDGAGRMRRIWHITIPQLMPTFFVLFVISIGNMLSTGIDQYFVFANAMNKEWIETFDFYVYNLGIGGGKISYGVAVGLLKSAVALLMFSLANFASKKIRGTGIA